jgi:DNA polymerase (family X)
MQNAQWARRFEEVADLLQAQGANPYRAHAFVRAAETLRRLSQPVEEIYRHHGLAGLQDLPGIGPRLAHSIRDCIVTGRLPILERLRGCGDAETLLQTVPGIGLVTAERLHRELGITSLFDLERAANDGRLSELAGIGKKRIAGIIDSLASRLGRVRQAQASLESPAPPVGELLDVDRQYRELSQAGNLPKIAPRRFNPARVAWLPILHTDRGPRHYSALYSNTSRAHRLGKTADWVILYTHEDTEERQWTVITSQRGALRGKRVVAGHEEECRAYYSQMTSALAS